MILGKPKEKSVLEKEIERVIEYMSDCPPDSDEYKKTVRNLSELHERLMAQKPKPMSSDAILTVVANLSGILLIVAYEQKHVVTSKAVGFIRTLR
jgi:hypothetical protein